MLGKYIVLTFITAALSTKYHKLTEKNGIANKTLGY